MSDRAIAVPGYQLEDGTYEPGFEPKIARIRCLRVHFVIWSNTDNNYRRYEAEASFAIGPPDPDNWTDGDCS